jgi:hypothetical protein
MTVTPFELELSRKLNTERKRFGNEWLFKWHSLSVEGRTVDLPNFEGGRIVAADRRFDQNLQMVYWQSVGRYLQIAAREAFVEWKKETEDYPVAMRLSSLDGTGLLLKEFVRSIAERAGQTDQLISGKGYSKAHLPAQVSATSEGLEKAIDLLIEAHRSLAREGSANKFPMRPLSRRLEDFYANNKGLIWFAGIVGSLILAGVSALLKG